MKQFYKTEGVTARDTTNNSGIAKLLPGSIIDDYQFEPCGYSMNGLLKQWYWTIRIFLFYSLLLHCYYWWSFD